MIAFKNKLKMSVVVVTAILSLSLGRQEIAWAQAPGEEKALAAPGSEVARLKENAGKLGLIAESNFAKQFLAATDDLPSISPREVFRDETTRIYYSPEQVARLSEEQGASLKVRTLDETFYYHTKYGSPLAYVRAIDILAGAGLTEPRGLKIVDFGYGTVGHLRLLASLGGDVVGVDVDSLQPALYREPSDQGTVKGRGGRDGRIALVHGRFPAEESAVAAIGEGYDLFISKNTLKNGYLHPEKPVDKRMLVDLGVEEGAFVRAIWRILKPGGFVLIYNLCPAPAPPDKPYIPWADGRCPITRQLWESAGFQILEFDKDDSAAARTTGRALGWDQGEESIDLAHDLFGSYSLLRKPFLQKMP